MFEMVLALIIGILAAALVRLVVKAKNMALRFHQTFRDKFFEGANAIIDADDVSETELNAIATLAPLVRSRDGQKIAMKTFEHLLEGRLKSDTTSILAGVPVARQGQWRAMLFYWAVSACVAQGSLKGLNVLFQLLRYFGLESGAVGEKVGHALSLEVASAH